MANQPIVAIIDDLSARRCATTFQIPVSGTLGLVLTAKKKGRIPLARARFLSNCANLECTFQTEC